MEKSRRSLKFQDEDLFFLVFIPLNLWSAPQATGSRSTPLGEDCALSAKIAPQKEATCPDARGVIWDEDLYF